MLTPKRLNVFLIEILVVLQGNPDRSMLKFAASQALNTEQNFNTKTT